jgi:hypothetical protein
LDKLTSRQLSEWEAYDRIDPIGEWRGDFRGAKLEALIINIVQALFPKKGSKPKIFNPIEFMPNWNGEVKESERQSVEEMKKVLLELASLQNKKKIKGRNTPPMIKNKET